MKEKKSTFSWIFSFAGQKKSGYIAINWDDLRVPKLVICEGRNGNTKQISSAFTAVQLVIVLCGLFPTPEVNVVIAFRAVGSHFTFTSLVV